MGKAALTRDHLPDAAAPDSRLQALLLHHEIESFNARYAQALDEQRLADWTDMFTEDALYVVLSRENFDRGLPVGLIYCESKRMIHDRAFALTETSMFAPRYLRHFIANLVVLGAEINGRVTSRANYVVLQEWFDLSDATLHQVVV